MPLASKTACIHAPTVKPSLQSGQPLSRPQLSMAADTLAHLEDLYTDIVHLHRGAACLPGGKDATVLMSRKTAPVSLLLPQTCQAELWPGNRRVALLLREAGRQESPDQPAAPLLRAARYPALLQGAVLGHLLAASHCCHCYPHHFPGRALGLLVRV